MPDTVTGVGNIAVNQASKCLILRALNSNWDDVDSKQINTMSIYF